MTDMLSPVDVIETETEDTMHGKHLVFSLDSQIFAISIEYVVDIINVQPITRVPNCPGFVNGITNLRGKVIPIIDLRLRFGKTPQEYNDRTCIIVVEQGKIQVGIVVDRVNEVANISDDMISPPPNFSGGFEASFVESVGHMENGVYLILNCKAVLGDDYSSLEDEENF